MVTPNGLTSAAERAIHLACPQLNSHEQACRRTVSWLDPTPTNEHVPRAPPNGDAVPTTPDVRQEDPDRTAADCLCAVLDDERGRAALDPRTVTPDQVDQAVHQLRERSGRPAAEQMQAVLRALDLTVVPRNEQPR
jgi:hypothetical protein